MEKLNILRKHEDRPKVIPYPQKSNPIKATKLDEDPNKNLIHSCSVIIVSYKTGPILIECLNSVFRQKGVHQVILIDNGNARSLIQQVNTIADEEARLEIITGQGNVGFAKGCNLGARRARAHYLLLINPDSVMNDDTISKAMSVFKDYPDASVLTVRIENSDGSEQRGARRNLMTPWTCLVEQFRLDRLAPDHPHFQRLNLNETKPLLSISPVQCISGAFMLMPKNIYDDLGGMDEEYFLHVEDVDFCMRIEKSGGVILYVPSITVMHKKGTSDVYPGFIEWHKAKSFCTYFEKHFQTQYPKWILNIFASAIYLRFSLRLIPITLSWAYKLAFMHKKNYE